MASLTSGGGHLVTLTAIQCDKASNVVNEVVRERTDSFG